MYVFMWQPISTPKKVILVYMELKKGERGPGRRGSAGWGIVRAQRGPRIPSGHTPRLRFHPWSGCVWEATNRFSLT